MKTFYVKTLGCKVNSYESEFIRSLFLSEGYILDEKKPDIIVINTCTVTNTSDSKSGKTVRHYRREYPDSVICAIGCFTQNKKENILKYIDADIILGNNYKSKILDLVLEFIKARKRIVLIEDMNKAFEDMEIKEYTSQSRAFMKIQDGCENFCSYCIIPFVRGNVRSKKEEIVLRETNNLINNNHAEIVLTGIHVGQYGRDINSSLSEITKKILKTDIKRLRLSSIEVVEIDDELINILKTNTKFSSHLHIPLQSGSDKILKLMNRRYLKKEYLEIVKRIRSVRPNISITTDIIVGFPGENEEDFLETMEFAKALAFTKIHVFPFSVREGTVASKMKDVVSESVKKDRVKRLLSLSDLLEKTYYESFIGKEVNVLIEKYDKYSYGFSDEYIPIKLEGEYKEGEIVRVTLSSEMIR